MELQRLESPVRKMLVPFFFFEKAKGTTKGFLPFKVHLILLLSGKTATCVFTAILKLIYKLPADSKLTRRDPFNSLFSTFYPLLNPHKHLTSTSHDGQSNPKLITGCHLLRNVIMLVFGHYLWFPPHFLKTL